MSQKASCLIQTNWARYSTIFDIHVQKFYYISAVRFVKYICSRKFRETIYCVEKICYKALFIVILSIKINFWFLFRFSTRHIWSNCCAEILGLKILQISVPGLHSVDLKINSIFTYGQKQCVAIHIMPQVPGWLACKSSIIAFRKSLGTAIFSSMQTQPDCTWRSHQYKWKYGLISFSLSSMLLIAQSRFSFRNASLHLGEAIKVLQKSFPFKLSNVGFCGLGVRGMLMLDDAAEDNGVRGVVHGSLEWE